MSASVPAFSVNRMVETRKSFESCAWGGDDPACRLPGLQVYPEPFDLLLVLKVNAHHYVEVGSFCDMSSGYQHYEHPLADPPQSSKTPVYCPRFMMRCVARKDVMLSNFCWWKGHRSEAPEPNNLLE